MTNEGCGCRREDYEDAGHVDLRVFSIQLCYVRIMSNKTWSTCPASTWHTRPRTSSKPWIRRWGEISNFAFRAPSGRDSSWNRINLNPWVSERGCLLTQPPFSQNQWSVYVNFARHSSTVLFFELSTESTTTTGPGTWPMGYISPREEGAGERTCRPRSGSRPSRFYGSTPRTR